MEKIKVSEIIKDTGGELILGEEHRLVTDVAIDSRAAAKDGLFVALKGEETDGHRFLENAYMNGARTFLISDTETAQEYGKDVFDAEDVSIVLVEDTLKALQDFSGEYLRKMNMSCIAVTGSVGKTTTRDMLFAAVSSKYRAGTNKKNYNSETGLPLTLLSFSRDMEIGVLEMGMDGPGQIARLVEISEPEAAIITNIGISHIEKLGSRENILKAKLEVASEFDSGSTLIINADDELLYDYCKGFLPYNIVRVGQDEKEDLDYRITDIRDLGIDGIDFTLTKKNGDRVKIKLDIPGGHNAINCALAIAGSEVMGLSMKEAISGIHKMKMTGSRLRVIEKTIPSHNGGECDAPLRIIDDSYNAAPSSMKSALSTLSNTIAKRKIAVLGGINELGELSETEHKSIGEFTADLDIDIMITIGEMASWIGQEAEKKTPNRRYMHFDTKENIYPIINELFKSGDVVLIKASRGYELDKLVEEIEKWA